VVKWLKQEGEHVQEEANDRQGRQTLESPVAGILVKLLPTFDEEISVQGLLAIIE